MYCRKCGRYFDGSADLCVECAQNEANAKVENNAPQYGANNAPQYGAPQYGANNAPQYGAPQYGAPQYNANYNQTVSSVTPVRQGSRTAGLGFGVVGFIFAMVALIMIIAGYGSAYDAALDVTFGSYYGNVESFRSTLTTASALCWVGIVLGVIAVIFGPVAISKFVKTKRNSGVKPVPTLVFGIISLAEGVGSILVGLICNLALGEALQILSVV